MSFFSKSISDQEWLSRVKLSYEAALPLTRALDRALKDESIEGQLAATRELLVKLPVIREAIRGLPNPTSSEASQAKKNLELALKDYIDGSKQGAKLFRDLAGGLGERLSWGGFSSRAASGRVAFQKTMFAEIVKTAQKRMREADTFFSSAWLSGSSNG